MTRKSVLHFVAGLLALAGIPAFGATINFDGLAPGTVVTSLNGVAFSSSTGLDLVVSTGFSTTSGANYLGVADGGQELFLSGDSVQLGFSSGITSLTVLFISSPGNPGETFAIDTPVGTVSSAVSPSQVLPTGDEAFVVTFASVLGFSSADLLSSPGGVFSFSIDDISFTPTFQPVPEPGTAVLLTIGLIALARRKMAA